MFYTFVSYSKPNLFVFCTFVGTFLPIIWTEHAVLTDLSFSASL